MTLATFIQNDLSARIRAGANLPAHWTLAELAVLYKVSLTPVRQAVESLLTEQLLCRDAAGRLQPHPQQLGSMQTVQAPLPPTDWYEVLAAQVLRAGVRGEALFLREEATAQQFGISRTVVRQVFGRMVGRGLLEHVPRRGWRVVPFREEDVVAYLDIRELLELKALDLARPHLLADEIRLMLAGNLPQEERLDNRLHTYFIERSGNRYLREFFQTQGGYYTALFDYATLGASVVAEMAAQHRTILEHVLAHRWGQARLALREHIRAQLPVLRKLRELLSAPDA